MHDEVDCGTHAAGLVCRVAPRVELYIAEGFNESDGDACTPSRVAEVGGVNIVMMLFAFSRRDEDAVEAVREAHKQGVIMFAAASNYGAIEGKRTAFLANIVGQVIRISSTDGWDSKSRWNPDKSKYDDNSSVLGEAVRSA